MSQPINDRSVHLTGGSEEAEGVSVVRDSIRASPATHIAHLCICQSHIDEFVQFMLQMQLEGRKGNVKGKNLKPHHLFGQRFFLKAGLGVVLMEGPFWMNKSFGLVVPENM